MVRAIRSPEPLLSTHHSRDPHPLSPDESPKLIPHLLSHVPSCSPQPTMQTLTQHVDIRGGGHLGYSIAGDALPAPMGLLGQWSKDEATVAVHLGLALQPPAHLQNHWSALGYMQPPLTKGTTCLSRQLQLPPHPASENLPLPTSSFPQNEQRHKEEGVHWPEYR